MATKLVRFLATGDLSCGHRAHASTTRVGPSNGPRVGMVYCALCALASIHARVQERARTATPVA